jgi:hypothetical protein
MNLVRANNGLFDMTHLFTYKGVYDAHNIARWYFAEIMRLHKFPRNNKFLSCFWETLWRLLGTKLLFSTPHHTPTYRQIEGTNKTLDSILSTLVNKKLRDWDLKLCQVEFTHDRSSSYNTKHLLFECAYGKNSLLLVSLISTHEHARKFIGVVEQAKQIMKLHISISEHIHQANVRYKLKVDKGTPTELRTILS